MSEIAEKGTDIVKVTATDEDLGSFTYQLNKDINFNLTVVSSLSLSLSLDPPTFEPQWNEPFILRRIVLFLMRLYSEMLSNLQKFRLIIKWLNNSYNNLNNKNLMTLFYFCYWRILANYYLRIKRNLAIKSPELLDNFSYIICFEFLIIPLFNYQIGLTSCYVAGVNAEITYKIVSITTLGHNNVDLNTPIR